MKFISFPLCLSLLISCATRGSENVSDAKSVSPMVAVLNQYAQLEGQTLDLAGHTLPGNDRIDIPKTVSPRQLKGLVQNYLDMNHFTLSRIGEKLVLTDTKEYEALWLHDFAQAEAASKKDGKPLFVKFEADWCEPCVEQDNLFKQDPAMIAELKKYTLVKLDAEPLIAIPDSASNKSVARFLKKNQIDVKKLSLPLLILTGDKGASQRLEGFRRDEGFYRKQLVNFRK